MIHASEVMDCQDLVTELDYVAECLRADFAYDGSTDFDAMADELNRASDKLANLVERLRLA
jgi:hypothetical protein